MPHRSSSSRAACCAPERLLTWIKARRTATFHNRSCPSLGIRHDHHPQTLAWPRCLAHLSFGVLLWMGGEIYRSAPPMPERVVSTDGTLLYTRADMDRAGRSGKRSVASNWARSGATARWSRPTGARTGCIARPRRGYRSLSMRESGVTYAALPAPEQARLARQLQDRIRANDFDASTATLTVPDDRARAIARRPRTTRACSAPMRALRHCARPTRCARTRSPTQSIAVR